MNLRLLVFAATIIGSVVIANISMDPMIHQQSHLKQIKTVETLSFFFGGTTGVRSTVRLAIVDSGIDLNHPEFKNQFWINSKEANGSPGVDDDQNGYVDDIHGYNFVDEIGDPSHKNANDHGTHVAGLAAASLGNGIGGAGVFGRNVELMILNVVGSHWDEVDLKDINRAIRYAADNGAEVINVSTGGFGESNELFESVSYAIKKGATVVVSAGNNNLDIDQNFYSPGTYSRILPGLITVGAVDTNNSALCTFSNFGLHSVKIAAPGCDPGAPHLGLLSTARHGGYAYRKGTSMATPLVSGAVALIYSSLKDQGMKPEPTKVEAMLLKATQQKPELVRFIQNGQLLDLNLLRYQVPFSEAPDPQ